MKMLLSTTALAFALGLPVMTLAQTTAPAANPQTQQQQSTEMHGFLAARGQADLYVSDLMGQDVYARRTAVDAAQTDAQTSINAGETTNMTPMNRAELDDMDNIGQITEIVLSNGGQVRALVIGVGGFLGMGEQDVAVTMDQVTFTSDADEPSQMYIVVNTGGDMLKNAPAYDRMAGRMHANPNADAGAVSADTGKERTAFAAPKMEREGYNRVETTEVTTEILMGKTVYDVNENDVGTVTDMIIDDAGSITNVIIDFGGFLGMGKSHASLGFDELTILSTESREDVRLYVDATKDQIQELPRYQAGN